MFVRSGGLGPKLRLALAERNSADVRVLDVLASPLCAPLPAGRVNALPAPPETPFRRLAGWEPAHPGSPRAQSHDGPVDCSRRKAVNRIGHLLCYPHNGQLADGTVLTTWYSNLSGKFYIVLLRYPLKTSGPGADQPPGMRDLIAGSECRNPCPTDPVSALYPHFPEPFGDGLRPRRFRLKAELQA